VIYCIAVTPNAGLANKLFPWARSKIFSYYHGVPMLRTFWNQFKVGPPLRRERDKRFYLDIFKPIAGEIGGFKKWQVYLTYKKICEPEDLKRLPPSKSNQLVVFEGIKNFGCLLPFREFVCKELLTAVNDKWLSEVSALGRLPSIGMHIRCGDFKTANSSLDFQSKNSKFLRTPIDWFVKNLIKLRKLRGENLEAFIVTDGSRRDVKPILDLGNVRLVRTGSAIGDMLTLSCAKVILASGGSTFSGWSAYLRGAMSLSITGMSLRKQGLDHAYECDAGEIPSDLVRLL